MCAGSEKALGLHHCVLLLNPVWVFSVNSSSVWPQRAGLFCIDVQNVLHLLFHTLGDVIDLGETPTDLCEGFVLGLGDDDHDVDSDGDADKDEDQESVVLKGLLQSMQRSERPD